MNPEIRIHEAIQLSIESDSITHLMVRTHAEAEALISEAFATETDAVEVESECAGNTYDVWGSRVVSAVSEMLWRVEIAV
jgi:hypothetical protein